VRGLRRRMRLSTSKSFFLTFRSLQDLVSSWYLCRLATALSLSDSNKSFSSDLLGHGGTFVVMRKLWCLISSGSTASSSNNSQNGMKLVALRTVVL
jgi:hypothetical protein